MTLFETPRLCTRLLQESDFPNVYRLVSDPETMRYIRAPLTEEKAARERVEMWMAYADKCPGLGVFIAEWKDTHAFAGYCVARHVDFDPNNQEFEIGYTFAPEFWGKGLASELVPPLSEYCFEQTGAPGIVAFTDPENAASKRVLVKGGFRETGTRNGNDGVSTVFWLERER